MPNKPDRNPNQQRMQWTTNQTDLHTGSPTTYAHCLKYKN